MRRLTSVVTVGVLVAGAAVVAGFGALELGAQERGWSPEPPPPAPPPEPPPAPPAPEAAAEPAAPWLATALLWAAGVALAVVAGLLLYALVRRLRRVRLRPDWLRLRGLRGAASATGRPVAAGASPAEEEQLAAAVAAAVSQSEDDHDPRRAVIACWVRLTEAAEQAGVPRHRSDTATDLVLRMLRGHRVSDPVLGELAGAYRRARFAAHPVDEQTRAQARGALTRLRAELTTRPATGPATESTAGPAADAGVGEPDGRRTGEAMSA